MITKYYDADCNLSVLDGITIAILGFGSQGHAHAMNLTESGAQVIGGNGGSSVSRDGGAGAAAIAVADAVEDISNLDITVEEGAIVKGGLGGDAGVLGKAGSGGVAVQGTAAHPLAGRARHRAPHPQRQNAFEGGPLPEYGGG